jgi:hypothetical protein
MGLADPPVADLSGQFLAKQTFEHDSNPLLDSIGRKAVDGSITSPEVILNDDAPTGHTDLDTRVDVNEFNRQGFSSNDVHSTGHVSGTGELWQAALAATVDYDTTRTSEVNASGINIAGIRHLGLTLQPQTTVNLSQTDQAQVTGNYLQNFYASKQSYTNYETFGVTPAYIHAFSALDSGQVLFQAGRYQTTTGFPITIDNVGPAVGWSHRLSERFTTSANLGVQETYFHFSPGYGRPNTSSFDYNFAVNAGFQGQQDTIQLSLTRQLSPNANGSESQTTGLNLSDVHMVTPRLEADLTASYQLYDYNGELSTNGLQSRYVSLAPKILYRLTENWSADVTYQYRHKNVDDGSPALSNAVMFDIVFKPVAKALRW